MTWSVTTIDTTKKMVRESRRRVQQSVVELRRRGSQQRQQSNHIAKSPKAQFHGDTVPVVGRSDAARRRRIRPHSRRQQQRLLPGQRNFLARLANIDTKQLAFTHQIIEFRKQHPVFRRRKWFQGRSIRGSDVNDLAWFRPDGEQMSDEDWGAGFAKSLGVFLNGDELTSTKPAAASSTNLST